MLQSEGNPTRISAQSVTIGEVQKRICQSNLLKAERRRKRFTDCWDRKTKYLQALEDKNVLL